MRRLEDGVPSARDALEELFSHTGSAYVVGLTGYPGSGKSTLVNAMVGELRRRDRSVGVIAVDPTSPFSGGAILGDRVRMNDHALDDGVFIRSVATRGNVGGLSRTTPALVQIMDAMGYDWIVIETVGVGQDEIDVVRLAETNVVVSVPGLGDDVQAVKAGILETADIFALNKSDLDGARQLKQQLRSMLRMAESEDGDWEPPIVDTVATREEGVSELVDQIDDHREWLDSTGDADTRRRRRLEHLVRLIVEGEFKRRVGELFAGDAWEDHLDRLEARRENPYQAVDSLLARLCDEMSW